MHAVCQVFNSPGDRLPLDGRTTDTELKRQTDSAADRPANHRATDRKNGMPAADHAAN